MTHRFTQHLGRRLAAALSLSLLPGWPLSLLEEGGPPLTAEGGLLLPLQTEGSVAVGKRWVGHLERTLTADLLD